MSPQLTHGRTRVLLAAAGLVLVYVAAALLIDPHGFYAANSVMLGTSPSLLAEVRAPAGLLLIGGGVMIAASVRFALAGPALTLGIAIYAGYGLARLVAMALDGLPSISLIAAAGLELVLAALLITARYGGAGSAVSGRGEVTR